MHSIRESTQKKKVALTILTVHEVAEYLRMSDAKVYWLVKRGAVSGCTHRQSLAPPQRPTQ